MMEPDVSSKSQLFDSLKTYLNNRNRLQPIIGLSSIVEVVNVGTQNRAAVYFCHVCVRRLDMADMRNHILGSLHRYNYIKASQPHLVSQWPVNSDLSKQAWPLMALAKMLESREGPGDVQLLEVEDAVHQKMATWSENYALTVINTLKCEQGGPGSSSDAALFHPAVESQRIVLFPHNSRKKPEPGSECGGISPSSSEHRREPETKSCSQSHPEDGERWESLVCESSFLDQYSGPSLLIGLTRVVELKGQDGCSLCFLCHCCRIKSSKEDIIDHLTSSSHLINYLVEIYPDQLQEVHEPLKYNCQLLQLLAMKVEHEKGREELKVEHVPETYCSHLSGKSYHWCLKMLSEGWAPIQKQTEITEGDFGEKSTFPRKSSAPMSRESQTLGQKKKKKKKKKPNTVFVVNLPLRKGAMLLERQSFSAKSPSSGLHRAQSEISGSELACDSQSYAVEDDAQMHSCDTLQDFCGGDPDVTQDPAAFLGTGNGFRHQHQDAAEAAGDMVFYEKAYNTGQYEERPSQEFPHIWKNEASQVTSAFLMDPHGEDLSFCSGTEQCGTEQGYRSALNAVGTDMQKFRNDGETSSSAVQYYAYQQVAWSDAGPHTGSMWGCYDFPAVGVPPVDAVNMSTCYRDALTHCGSISAQTTGGFYEADPRQPQTPTDFITGCTQDAPLSNPHLTANCQAKYSQIQMKLMAFANYSPGPATKPGQALSCPVSSAADQGTKQADALTQPSQAVGDEAFCVYHTAGF
ncbi:uncharacterized protein LOC101158213 isoform X2 [Oryzias latipes]|uniref:uncharacterized protein LOC101158213 isoform X2 n=1 Tax=Oryzias latipes TaxID=8090 RepID=UPI000CE18520|nr:uncharacterized protein LOC101158213 isoform X2 [Oryzias latipes]